jgi:hypothetical protein
MKKLTKIIEGEAFKATSQHKCFFDHSSIKWGEEFDDKIYEGIVKSCFFIPLFHNSYLHEDSLWCAKELHWAIQLEHKIRETISNYCFILPLIDRGSPSDFPECIGRKNAKEIKQFRHLIEGNKSSRAFEEFKSGIYDIFYQNFELLKGAIFCDCLNEIDPISDEELKVWIREQKNNDKTNASNHLPTLKKTIF